MPPKKELNFFLPFIANAPAVTETVPVKTAYYEAKQVVCRNADGTATWGFQVQINMPGTVSVMFEPVLATNAFTFDSIIDLDIFPSLAPLRHYQGFILLNRRAQEVANEGTHTFRTVNGVFYALFPNYKGALHFLTYPGLNNTLQGSSQGLINQRSEVDDLARLLTTRCNLLDKSNLHIKEEVRNLKFDFLTALSEDEDISPLVEIGNKIGSGVSGTVFSSVDKATNQPLAVKTICLEKGKFDLPILRELDALFTIEHENVVRLHYVFPGAGCINLAMESCDYNLRRLICQTPHVLSEPNIVKDIVFQILSAVAFLHGQKVEILHRDLKPENILLNEDSQDTNKLVVKLADFGLARFMGDRLTPQVTSLLYRAPEVLLGVARYTTAVDVWSVGCVFGELVELQPFFCPALQKLSREEDMIDAIFGKLGCPTNSEWPGDRGTDFSQLPC